MKLDLWIYDTECILISAFPYKQISNYLSLKFVGKNDGKSNSVGKGMVSNIGEAQRIFNLFR